MEAAIKLVKVLMGAFITGFGLLIYYGQVEQDKLRAQQMAFQAGLTDPELMFSSINFTTFLSTWLIRQADPTKKHPNPIVAYVGLHIFHNGAWQDIIAYLCRRRFRCLSEFYQNTLWRILWTTCSFLSSEYSWNVDLCGILTYLTGLLPKNGKWLERLSSWPLSWLS